MGGDGIPSNPVKEAFVVKHNRDKSGVDKEKQAPKSGTGSSMKDSTKDKPQKHDQRNIPGAPRQWEPGRDEGERSDRESIGRPVQLEDGGQRPSGERVDEEHGAGQKGAVER